HRRPEDPWHCQVGDHTCPAAQPPATGRWTAPTTAASRSRSSASRGLRVSNIVEHLLNVPPTLAFLLIFVLVFGEAAIFIGFVLPGETAVVLGGVLASQHRISLWLLLILVPFAAI